jgi:hypothetical protein
LNYELLRRKFSLSNILSLLSLGLPLLSAFKAQVAVKFFPDTTSSFCDVAVDNPPSGNVIILSASEGGEGVGAGERGRGARICPLNSKRNSLSLPLKRQQPKQAIIVLMLRLLLWMLSLNRQMSVPRLALQKPSTGPETFMSRPLLEEECVLELEDADAV